MVAFRHGVDDVGVGVRAGDVRHASASDDHLSRDARLGGMPAAVYQLPRAALALKQGFDRLVRTRQDRGVVAILDGRIARRRYGHQLLSSLPVECPRTEELEDVELFFRTPPVT